MNITAILYSAAVWIIPLVIAIVLHEVSHGWVANALGDPTAKRLGRLSVNPITHVDPVGTILLPLGLAIAHLPVFGWAKPVPVAFNRLRNPRLGMILVAAAGPAMNLALALLGTIMLAIGVAAWTGGTPTGTLGFLFDNLINFVAINVFLAIFNMLPIPPFDGGHVVQGLLPPPLAKRYARLGRYGFPLLLFLLVILPMMMPGANLVSRVIGPPSDALIRFLLGSAGLSV
uniref:site-2 protease family protein n=1 Tax=Sphingomonas bacterium TaxID=1895847 RepID=UPI002610BE90|nr:site-2 protease family protein [Sphingomonas bacterium]